MGNKVTGVSYLKKLLLKSNALLYQLLEKSTDYVTCIICNALPPTLATGINFVLPIYDFLTLK